MKPVALKCVLGGPCRYKTCKLEFSQAFQLLELHMKYLHTPKVSDEKVDISKHDDDSEEDNYEFGELFNDTETSLEDEVDVNGTDQVDKELQSNFANVTSVRDDRSPENQSFERRIHQPDPVDVVQTDLAEVTLARDDREEVELHLVGNHEPCGSCGRKSHSSHRSSRRRLCSAWNKSCYSCNKRGHFQKFCKTTFEEHVDEFEAFEEKDNHEQMNFGEIAGLVYSMSEISKQVQSMNKLTVPHMLYDEVKWINSQPPTPPYIKLQVRVDTKDFLENNFKPPSAY